MKLTKEDIELAQEKARGSRLDLINQVTKAYYGALLSSDSYEVIKKNYELAKQNFEVVNNKYKVGSVSEYDKISAEVQVRNMNSSMVSAETGKNLALLRLKVLMGVTANVDIKIDDSLKAYEGQLTLSNTEIADSELDSNSSLRQLDYNMSLLERTQKLLRTRFMPTVALQLSGQYQSVSNPDWNVFGYSYSPSATLALAVNIPIFHADTWTKIKSNKIQISQLEDLGFGKCPVCIAKTQYSFSDDPTKLGAPENFKVTIKNVKVSAGAGFVVVLTGDIMTMPGLPKVPAAEKIDVDENGKISGLF